MLGVGLIHKPTGMTSHDVVNILRRRLKMKRIGHAGTLDPLASGLLVVAIGPATRFLQYLPLEPKEYIADIKFGQQTPTYDAESEVTEEREVPADLGEKLTAYLPTILGLHEQIPPMYSAVKMKGQPLYKLARQGIEVERKGRVIHLGQLEIQELRSDFARLRVVCSGGTYIRTLAHDLGLAMGCGAHLTGLQRTRVGRFHLEQSTPLEEITEADIVPLEEALKPMLMHPLSERELERVRHGGAVANVPGYEGQYVALLDTESKVVSVASIRGDLLQPECVIPEEAKQYVQQFREP